MSKKFTPSDLKAEYPNKYDDWIFYKTGSGDWIGKQKKDKEIKRIGVKYDSKGKAVPNLVEVKPTYTGSIGIQIFTRSLKSAFKKK